jgi:adenylate cyclase
MMNESLLAYIPMDRRLAMARGETLPDRTEGAALFADISGFTPLTEALVRELGPQRGAEELTGYLNQVYDALINELHRWGGSAIAFAGDAVTCWFDGDDGLRALASAMAMQEAMVQFAAVETPAGSVVELSMKAAVAVGTARRFLVGDPQSRVIDTVAGATMERLAAGEHEANRGEVVLAPCAMEYLADQARISEIRVAEDGRRFGVVAELLEEPHPPELPLLDVDKLDEREVRTWLLPSVYKRLDRGMGNFLAEIRPTVAVFMRFAGIDYDRDDAAGEKLDATIRAVQAIVDRYQGTLIDLNIGDKGSYLYVNFGAPLAHENNATRAASAALELRDMPQQLSFLQPLQIGISRGRMRAGAYGGTAHRTYGVLGDAVNLSARLMMASEPGTVLVSMNVQEEIADLFDWDIKEPIRVKGKSEPVRVAILQGVKPRIGMHLPDAGEQEPLIGRDDEVAKLDHLMAAARESKGNIVSFVGEAGLGKSRLVAKALSMALERDFTVFGGEADSHGVNSSYLIWHPIWRGILGLDPTWDHTAQIEVLAQRIAEIDRNMIPRLPVLGPVLQLTIPDNDITAGLDAKLRKSLLEEMLVNILAATAQREPLVLILEDCHWIDALSHDLLEEIARSIQSLPVLIILTYRRTDIVRDREARVSKLPHYSAIELTPLTEDDLSQLALLRLERLAENGRDRETTEILARRIAQQADGNPFYLEELANYVGNEASAASDPGELSNLALPTSLQGLVLSRLDQLPERPKTVLKVASVVGRVFHASWLEGIYPELGARKEILRDLQELTRHNFTVFDPAEGEDTYFFRNIITRGVIYDSLLHSMRTALHEQTGEFLEVAYVDEIDQFLDLLAYHFEHGVDENKKRYYLRRAGESAQDSYANQAAIDYFRKVLPLLELEEQIDIMLKLGNVERLVGHWDEAEGQYQSALALADSAGKLSSVGQSRLALSTVERLRGNYTEALDQLEQARELFESIDDRVGLDKVLHHSGTVAAHQGELAVAKPLFEKSLALRRQLGDRAGESDMLNNLALIASYQGDNETARELHEEGLAINRELGDRRTIARSLNNLGNVLLNMGDLAGARVHLEEAVTLQREIGDRFLLANALNSLGNLVRDEGDLQQAQTLYAESMAINKQLEDRWAIAYLLEDMARLNHLDGNLSDALVLISAAGALREAIDAKLLPTDQQELNKLQEQIELRLATEQIDECMEAGKTMSLEETITFAMRTAGVAPISAGERPGISPL